MAQVTFEQAGAGTATATNGASLSVAYPTTGLAANDLFIMVVTCRNNTNAATPPTDWTVLDGSGSMGSLTITGVYMVMYKFASGTETGNLTVGFNASDNAVKMARMFRFRNVDTSNPYYSLTGGQSDSSTTVPGPTLTSNEAEALGVFILCIANDLATAALTGATGGTWVEPVAEYTTTLGSDGCIQLQTVTMATATTVSGGSMGMTSNNAWGETSFVLKSAPASTSPTVKHLGLLGVG